MYRPISLPQKRNSLLTSNEREGGGGNNNSLCSATTLKINPKLNTRTITGSTLSPGLSSVYNSAICHSVSSARVKPCKTFAQKRRKAEPLNAFKRERCVWGICEALISSPSLPLPLSLSLSFSLNLSLSIFLSNSSNDYKKEKKKTYSA